MEAAAGTTTVRVTSDGKKVAAAACDVEALRRCLEENKGDRVKCQAHIDAFRSSCSISATTTTTKPPQP
jgi:hypothetical protein